jgi:hypothetical protein
VGSVARMRRPALRQPPAVEDPGPDDAPAPDRRPARRARRDELLPLVAASLTVYVASRLVVAAGAATVAYLRSGTRVVDVLASWDGAWYLEVVRSGYPASSSSSRRAALTPSP